MIASRNNHLVVGKRAVLIRDITDSVCARNNIDFITRRFPVNITEVWECIDAIADIDRIGRGVHLKVSNTSQDRQNINLETVQISDIFFIKVIQFGKIFLPESNNSELFILNIADFIRHILISFLICIFLLFQFKFFVNDNSF